ncbi:MAG TPA: phosphodiester glycosidase family protein [Acidimicrobiales bacterium]
MKRNPRRVSRGHGFGSTCAAIVVTLMMSAVSFGAESGVAPSSSGAVSANGINVYPMSGASFGVHAAIRLLTFYGSQYTLKIGLANNTIDGGVERPSSMCNATAGCVAAVNGDFFDVPPASKPDPGDEVGGIIRNCVLLHTPEVAHNQINLDEQSVSNSLNWTSAIDVNGTSVPITAINQELPMSYVGVHLSLSGTLLYTSPYALTTPTARGRMTFEFAQINGTSSPTTINTTAQLKYLGRTAKALKVTAGRVDISAASASAFAALTVGSTVTMTTTSTSGCDSIGGHPIILDNGVASPISRNDTYMNEPYPRTVIGFTSSGETVIMSVGGADGKSGATMSQLIAMLTYLDVDTALDLDGGNSTTLYANHQVLYPTLKTERPVSTGLLVVQSS